MTTGTWEPGGATLPGADDLAAAAGLWRTHGEAVGEHLEAPLRARLRAAMQAPPGALDEAIADLADADAVDLARLFTIVEAQPGFAAGARSPVVPLARPLRARLDGEAFAELVSWIRAHTENRFLPHGSRQDRLRA